MQKLKPRFFWMLTLGVNRPLSIDRDLIRDESHNRVEPPPPIHTGSATRHTVKNGHVLY